MHWILKIVIIHSYISMRVGNNTHMIGKYQLKDGRGKNFSNQVLNIQHYDIKIRFTSLWLACPGYHISVIELCPIALS